MASGAGPDLAQVALVSLDIWDTLLRRRCHPDAIKLYTAQHMIFRHGHRLATSRTAWELVHRRREVEASRGAARVVDGLDDEYDVGGVLTELLRQEVPDVGDAELASWVMDLVELEVQREIASAFPDPDLQAALVRTPPLRLVGVSDFYLPAELLSRIIRAHLPELKMERLYVSCDVGLNKRSGRLFDHVLADLGLAPGQVLHVGDNPHADVTMAASKGIPTWHFSPARGAAARKELEAAFAQRPVATSRPCRLTSVRTGGDATSALYQLGQSLAPALGGFATFVLQRALQAQVPRVFFFTREGVFFRALYESLLEHDPWGTGGPQGELLSVSRVATFLPSLGDLSADELMRLWSLYSSQSVEGLLASLRLDDERLRVRSRALGLDPAESVQYPWQDDRVLSLLADAEFRRLVLGERDSRRRVLQRYLDQQGFPTSGRAVVVDVGWRGSIQDNLLALRPDLEIHGLYLGLQRFLNPQSDTSVKSAYLWDDNAPGASAARELRFIRPFEVITNGLGGSVVGYDEAGDWVRPIARFDADEDAVHNRFIAHLQRGVLDGLPAVWRDVARNAVTPDELADSARRALARLIALPPPALRQAYAGLSHNETFGVGGYVGTTSGLRRRDYVEALVRHDSRGAVARALADTGWPQASLLDTVGRAGYAFVARRGLLDRL